MCGISGFLCKNNELNNSDLMLMTNEISHRGPDSSGFFYDNNVGLGHRRLSIIDLSESANQPMYSENSRYVIVFNGEIYNFQSLRNEFFSNSSVKLRTNSDTEVLLELFVKQGVKFVNNLNGMFAFAIYDKQEKQIYLFRDRLGIKPIYYYKDSNVFAFASELKALTKLDYIYKRINISNEAINNYLHLGYIPQPFSVYSNIFKFPSGSYGVINLADIKIKSFWKIEEKINKETDYDFLSAKQKLKELITDSVRLRLISDVPFGTFLSGGIDSSLVTAVAQNISKTPINTFSIGFNESKYNESEYAKKIAEYLGTNHHELFVTEKDAINLIPEITNIYDEPYADSSAIPTMLVSKLARKHVTMTLSGDGGDELFMGYGSYLWAKRLSNPFIKTFRKPIILTLSALPNRYKRAAMVFNYSDYKKVKSHIFSQEQYLFAEKEISKYLNNELVTTINLDEDYNQLNRKLTNIEQQSLFDIKYYLKDDLLVKVDRASMKYSLETRVPLLDYRIVEFAMNLNQGYKIKDDIQKYLLKEVLYDYVPKNYFNRHKWGFSIPLNKWLKNELKDMVLSLLSENEIKKHNILNYKEVEILKDKFYNKNLDFLYNRIWELVVLQLFFNNKR